MPKDDNSGKADDNLKSAALPSNVSLPPDTTAPNTVSSDTQSSTTLAPSTDDGSKNPSGETISVQSPHTPTKYGGKKVIATIFGVLFLIAGVAAGVYLVRQRQLNVGFAWDCSKYVFGVSKEGAVNVTNSSSRNEPGQKANVYINETLVSTVDVPALSPGQAANLGTVSVPSGQGFTWRVKGTADCENNGSYEATPTAIPTEVPTSVPTEKPTPIPSDKPTDIPTQEPTQPPVETNAKCNAVKAYDREWNLLNSEDLGSLTAGSKVRFAVSGTATSGTFDKARFTINGTLRAEVATKKPGSEEFYDEYTIPEGVTNFTVKGEVHHSELGWL